MNTVREIDYMLKPGYIYVSRQISVIRTVVGSCVTVCLWDKVLKFGGMNHFLYPAISEKSKATAQYGNVATTALVRLMLEAGSETQAAEGTKQEARSRKQEAGRRKREAGSGKREARGKRHEVGGKGQEARYKMQDAGSKRR